MATIEEQARVERNAELSFWLRRVHGLNVNVIHIPHNQRYKFNITGNYHEGEQGLLHRYDFKTYDSYEDALEAGMEEAIKLIKI